MLQARPFYKNILDIFIKLNEVYIYIDPIKSVGKTASISAVGFHVRMKYYLFLYVLAYLTINWPRA